MLSSPLTVAAAAIVLLLIMICGILGNLLVVLVIWKVPRMKGQSYTLIANLAVADALQSCNIFFVLLTATKGGHWVFGNTACQINAFLTTEFVLSSMLNLTVISVNRYIKVVHSDKYNTVFAPRPLRFIIAFTWLFPLVYAIPPLLGWSKYVFNPGKCICIFRFALSHSFAFFLVGTVTTPALLTIVLSYLRIFWIIRTHRRRVCQDESSSQTQRNPLLAEESQITKNIVVVVVSHIICFIPATVVNVIEIFRQDFDIPFWLDFVSFNLIFVSHANNPIVYGLMNKKYRRSLAQLCAITRHDRHPHLVTFRVRDEERVAEKKHDLEPPVLTFSQSGDCSPSNHT